VVRVPAGGPAYVDDVAVLPANRAAAAEGYAAQGFELVKWRRVGTGAAERYLGAFVGDPALAQKLLEADVADKIAQARTISSYEGVSLQARFCMVETLVSALAFRFAACAPQISAAPAAAADDALYDILLSAFAGVSPADAPPHARHLATSPFLGAGWGRFAALAPRLFEAASVCAAWPPTGFPEGRGFREIRAEADDDHRATDADRFGLYAADRADATMPWFRIRRTGKHFELTNAEFQNAMRNTLRLPSGRAAEVCNFKGAGWRNDVDHLNCCRCGAWSWAPRHELVLGACRRAAAAHGCQATTNFPEIYGVRRGRWQDEGAEAKVPDLIFFRQHVDKPPLVVDFTVCHPLPGEKIRVTNARAAAKKAKYADWKNATAEVEPIVLTSLATIPKESFAVLSLLEKDAAVRRGFAQDAAARMKIAIVKWDWFRAETRRRGTDATEWRES
jgi:hypothetical protein